MALQVIFTDKFSQFTADRPWNRPVSLVFPALARPGWNPKHVRCWQGVNRISAKL